MRRSHEQSEYPQDWLALRPTDRKIGDNENDYQCRGDCRQPIDNVSGLKPSISCVRLSTQ